QGPEQPYFPPCVLIGLHPLENGLSIMKDFCRRVQGQGLVGHYFGETPLPIRIITDQHMVRIDTAKGKVVEIDLPDFRVIGPFDTYSVHQCFHITYICMLKLAIYS